MGRTKREFIAMNNSMDDDVVSSSGESSSDDTDTMNDVTQPHALEEMDDKEDEKQIYLLIV